MLFDISVPSVLFLLTAASVFLYPKLEAKIKALVEERKFRIRDIASLIIFMGIAVSALVFIPSYAIQAFFLLFYSLALFVFVYSAMPKKWYIAPILPAIFLLLYFFFWGIPQMDIFAAVFVVFVSVYIATFFEWKTLAVFAGLLTVLDVVQVFGTRFMVGYGEKVMKLALPAAIEIPLFPYLGLMTLGLGDFLLSGLLAIQTSRKYGRRFGYISVAFIAGAFLIFEALQLWYFELLKQSYTPQEAALRAAMPATVFIVSGWLAALGVRYIYNRLTAKKAVGEQQ
jgi:hypothetical protein